MKSELFKFYWMLMRNLEYPFNKFSSIGYSKKKHIQGNYNQFYIIIIMVSQIILFKPNTEIK